MLKLLISCWDDGVVVACRYMFAMGSDFNYFNKLKFYSVKRKSVHVLVIIENTVQGSLRTIWSLTMGPIRRLETSVTSYQLKPT